MGVTIHYRGRLADLTRIEDFEDRLLDLALEVGGQAQIWRSHADQDPQRVVRGIILNLAPGQDSTSLLVSPEGWLIGLTDIEDAERGVLAEPPWCFTKTQFGPVEGHVALIEMLAELRREFVPDLEVSDEGGYWETHDLAELARRRGVVQQAIDAMAEGLQRHGLSREAAEDPDILRKRIERIAAQVHCILQRPPEHPPMAFSDDESPVPDPETTEKEWDEMFKHNRRQQERLERSMEERRSRGEDDDKAFENALDDLALEIPGEESEDEPWRDDDDQPFAGAYEGEELPDEAVADIGSEEDAPFERDDERHPLLASSMDIMMDLHTSFRQADKQFESALRTLFQGAGDAMGGLAQALSGREEDDFDDYGLRVTQLKRALRGAAFARRALLPLRAAMSAEQFEDLFRRLGQLEKEIFAELSRLRSKYQPGEG